MQFASKLTQLTLRVIYQVGTFCLKIMESVDNSSIDIICQTGSSEYFDQVIGHIEDIVLSEHFQNLHENFLEAHFKQFSKNTEENKLEYWDVFVKYTNTFESFFVKELHRRMENFDMQRFAEQLEQHDAFDDTLSSGEIFELLYSFTNFPKFKEIMSDYCSKKEGNVQHLEFNILITKSLCAETTPDEPQ